MQGYQKENRTRTVKWTEEGNLAFLQIQRTISECQTLHFVQNNETIFLQTDASDYGIGAYLFQLVDGIEKPVAFISKKLVKSQLAWTVPEKKANAIYYAFRKLEYLIRDVRFALQTDHKNLTFVNVNEDTSAKIKRWKMFLLEFIY